MILIKIMTKLSVDIYLNNVNHRIMKIAKNIKQIIENYQQNYLHEFCTPIMESAPYQEDYACHEADYSDQDREKARIYVIEDTESNFDESFSCNATTNEEYEAFKSSTLKIVQSL